MLKRSIIETADGSKTIKIEDWNEQYHSIHGALQEAKHVYIEAGLKNFLNNFQCSEIIRIMEIGFGTGLNAYLTAVESNNQLNKIFYHGIEAYPLKSIELKKLEYHKITGLDPEVFHKIHRCSWGVEHEISPNFSIFKRKQLFSTIDDINFFDIIYFDAFGPRVQPELWSEKIFLKMYKALKPKGVIVTYSAKASVRRILLKIGMKVERLSGPPGKREMLRAVK